MSLLLRIGNPSCQAEPADKGSSLFSVDVQSRKGGGFGLWRFALAPSVRSPS